MKLLKDIFLAIKEIATDYVRSRIFPVTVVIIVCFFLLIRQLFTIQIVNGDKYSESFEVSSEKTLTVSSIRGNIYDVNGKLLAYNKISYTLSFGNDTTLSDTATELGITSNALRNRILNNTINILESNGDSIDADFKIRYKDGKYSYTVSSTTKLSFLKDVYELDSINDVTDEQAEQSAEETVEYLRDKFEIGNEYSDEMAIKILACRYNLWMNRFQQYIPVEIAHDISDESRAAISENNNLLGMDIIVDSERVYNYPEYFSHIIGYVGKASQEEIDSLNEELGTDKYTSSDVVGKTGIEQTFETYLHGEDGEQTLYVDNLGKVLEVVSDTPATAGNDIYLSIDADLQIYCYDMLEKELASILVSKIVNVFDLGETNTDKSISMTDVYMAFFKNNQFDVDAMNDDTATELEKSVYERISTKRETALSELDNLLRYNPVALSSLSDEYKDYSEYICEMLSTNGIYDSTVPNRESTEFTAYLNYEVSLQYFLKYLISIEAIDISSIEDIGEYYDSDDIYNALVDYIMDHISNDDDDFDDVVIENMILSNEISGNEIIHLLYDQEILSSDGDVEYQSFTAGALQPYDFFIAKINSLDITPAMLGLTPCSGAMVVTDVNTGQVRAMVSYPSYDNNYLTNSVDSEYYSKLLSDTTNPLYNRSTMMRIAPGSTFKPLTSVAGVEEGVISTDTYINDLGVFDKVYTEPKCWIYRESKTTHGSIGLSTAIEVSCNYYFYEVGYRLATREGVYDDDAGLAALKKYAKLFGLTEKSGVEINEITPHVSTNDAVTSSIGQGTNTFAPVQLAKYVTAVANSGTVYNLTLIDKIVNNEGSTVLESGGDIYETLDFSSDLWNTIHTGMRGVVSYSLSSHTLLNSINVEVAGKTGTAQESEDMPAHALFISYAPYSNPEVAVTTVIPNGYSSGNAADVTAFIYAYLYDKEALMDATMDTGSQSVGD